MNAGAYGSDWRGRSSTRVVVDADGAGGRGRTSSARYRHSALAAGQVVAQVRFRLEPRPAGEIKARRRRAARAAEGDAADEQAHVRQRLQEPRRRARRGRDDRGVRAEGLPDRRRADLAAPRELHRERRRGNLRRRARADGRGAAAGQERFGVVLEHEVRFLGPLELPPCRGTRPRQRSRSGVARPGERPPRTRAGRPLRAGARPLSHLPSRRSLRSGSRCSPSRGGAYVGRARDVDLRGPRLEIVGGSPRSQAEVREALAPGVGRSLLRLDAVASRAAHSSTWPDVPRASASTVRFRTRSRDVDAGACRCSSCGAPGKAHGSCPRAGAFCARSAPAPELAAARVGAGRDRQVGARCSAQRTAAARGRCAALRDALSRARPLRPRAAPTS